MDKDTFNKLNRKAKRQRAREGYPVMDLKKVVASMTPEQKKQFLDMLTGQNKERMTIEL